jgi:hypothetical protein
MQHATDQLRPATGYCIETRALALSNGYFPGLVSTIERIIPLGRMARHGDALRTADVQP